MVVPGHFLNRCLNILGQVLYQALAPAFTDRRLTCHVWASGFSLLTLLLVTRLLKTQDAHLHMVK